MFTNHCILFISFGLYHNIQLVSVIYLFAITTVTFMQKTGTLINGCADKYKRAYIALLEYLKINSQDFSLDTNPVIGDMDFRMVRGMLYSFFESHSILVSVTPQDITHRDERMQCRWAYFICLEETEIIESGFKTREESEYIAFLKSFQFLDTKLFVMQTKNRFYDQTSDISCLNVNWGHMNRVLSYKRANLLS